jgi:hypothetical protein
VNEPDDISTVGKLRAALEGIPDDTPLAVNGPDPLVPGLVDEVVISSVGFGLINWGDGYGLEPDGVFVLNRHEAPSGAEIRRQPVRPARQAAAETVPVDAEAKP